MPSQTKDSISNLKYNLLQIYGETFMFLTFIFLICYANIKNINISLVCNIYCYSIVILSIIFGRIANLLKQ